MKVELHYVDPRLVALYDAANPRGADTASELRFLPKEACVPSASFTLHCGPRARCR